MKRFIFVNSHRRHLKSWSGKAGSPVPGVGQVVIAGPDTRVSPAAVAPRDALAGVRVGLGDGPDSGPTLKNNEMELAARLIFPKQLSSSKSANHDDLH